MRLPLRLPNSALIVRFLAGGVFLATLAIAGVVASPLVASLPSRITSLAALPESIAAASPVNPFDHSSPAKFESSPAGSGLPHCGGLNERACDVFEQAAQGRNSCDDGLYEEAGCTLGSDCGLSSGMCRKPDCGATDQRACTIFEQIAAHRSACDGGLVDKGGTCRVISACGGEGQRACTVEEQVFNDRPVCNANLVEVAGCTGNCYGPGLFDSSGVCALQTPCGAKGQRACTITEQVAWGRAACDANLFEVPGCSGACNGLNSSVSSGRCTVIENIAEPGVDGFMSPGTCSLSGYADLHMHQFGHLAHGGAVLAGKPSGLKCTPNTSTPDPDDETCVDEGVNVALKPDFTTELDLVNGDGTPSGNWESARFNVDTDPATNPLAHEFQKIAGSVAGLINLFTACPSYLGGICNTQDYFHASHDPLLGDSVGSIIGTKDGAGSNFGAPLFNGWPKWTSTTHQQVYHKWLERAWQGGMRLMTQMAVTNEALCRGGKHVSGVDCTNSMALIDDQIKEAYRFQAFIDNQAGGAGLGWYRIVTSPKDAREQIARGKLAVVLGIEVAELFNCYSPNAPPYRPNPKLKTPCTKAFVESEIDRYYAMGVRHIFPIHNFDNAFGAAATWQDGIEVGQAMVEGDWWTTVDCAADQYGFKLGGLTQLMITLLKFSNVIVPNAGPYPARNEGASCNAKGLLPLGRDLINKMMAKGMIIDIDHMSNKALDETLDLVEQNGHYPVVASHVLSFDRHVQQIPGLFGDEGTRHERLRTHDQLQRIKGVGGVIAAMLKDDSQDTGNKGKKLTIPYGDVSDDCIHSAKTFAQAYQYAVDQMGGPVALGSDFNGVAGHIGPRFGTDACGGDPGILGDGDAWRVQRNAQLAASNQVDYPFTLSINGNPVGTFWEQRTGHRVFNYNYDGMAHVGLLPDFIQDLKKVGLPDSDLNALFGSAEAYVKMWERAASLSPSPDDDTPAAAITNTCAFFGIPDGNSPVINVPDDITQIATTANGKTVSFTVTATDPQDGPIATTCNRNSGENYSVGTTTVTCSATDHDNNTTSDSFRIKIIDTPPTIDPHANLVFEAQHAGGALVTYTLPATHDLQDGNGVASCTPVSNQTFAIGHTLVTCNKMDNFGNRAQSFFDVHVRDTVAPVVSVEVLVGTLGQNGWYVGPNAVLLRWSFLEAVGVTSQSPHCTVGLITDDGVRTLTCFATDAAGNQGSKTTTIKLDRTAPVITFLPPSAPANANGWHNANVQIPYTITDATSGIPAGAPVSGNAPFTSDGQGQTATVNATDVAGNPATMVSPPINLDKTPPTIGASRAPLANAQGWNNTDVTASFVCNDATSGIVACPGPAVMSAEAAGQSRSGMVFDRAGNSASASVTNVNIDKTPPTVTGARVTPANAFGWNNTTVRSAFSANDSLSGVLGANSANVDLAAEGANQVASQSFSDNAGNTASASVGGINIDLTAPTIAGSRAPLANVNGWNNTDVTVSFACNDALSGVATCTDNQTIATEGTNQSRSGQVFDKAGNEASTSVGSIFIDKTAPLITGAPDRPANAFNWYNANVTVSFACSDALSGVGACGPTPQVIGEEGAGLSRSASVMDLAFNSASATVGGINLDKTPPVVTCSNNAPSLWPPNHKMVGVQFGVGVDGGISGANGFTLLNATSNEPDNGLGDGDTADDIQGFSFGTADITGLLRAERSGKGTGRVYSLLYQGADRAGNVTPCTTRVTVPHDQSDKK